MTQKAKASEKPKYCKACGHPRWIHSSWHGCRKCGCTVTAAMERGIEKRKLRTVTPLCLAPCRNGVPCGKYRGHPGDHWHRRLSACNIDPGHWWGEKAGAGGRTG